jgi:hypothetical protein
MITILAIVVGTLAADYTATRMLDRFARNKIKRDEKREADRLNREAQGPKRKRLYQIRCFRSLLNLHHYNDQLIGNAIDRLLALDDVDGAYALCKKIEAERRP